MLTPPPLATMCPAPLSVIALTLIEPPDPPPLSRPNCPEALMTPPEDQGLGQRVWVWVRVRVRIRVRVRVRVRMRVRVRVRVRDRDEGEGEG